MSEGSSFTRTPAQEDALPRDGVSRSRLLEDELDTLTKAEITEPEIVHDEPTVEPVPDIRGESLVIVPASEKRGGVTLGSIFPGLAEQLKEERNNVQEQKPAEEIMTSEMITAEVAKHMHSSDVQTESSPAPIASIDGIVSTRITRHKGEQRPKPTQHTDEKKPTPGSPSTETRWSSMSVRELARDRVAGPVLERTAFEYLKNEDKGWNTSTYLEELSPDSFLVRANGEKTMLRPHEVLGGLTQQDAFRAIDTVLAKTREELQKQNPEQSKVQAHPETPTPAREVNQAPVVVQESETPMEANEDETLELPVLIDAEDLSLNLKETTELNHSEESDINNVPEVTAHVEQDTASVVTIDGPVSSEQQMKHVQEEIRIQQVDSPGGVGKPEVETQVAQTPEKDKEEVVGEKDATERESASMRLVAREKYREVRAEMLKAKTDWEEVMTQYQEARQQKGIFGKLFDMGQLKGKVDEKQRQYLTILERVRNERENRMHVFMKDRVKREVYVDPVHMKEGEKSSLVGQEKVFRYTAFHEALLDRRIDQDIVLIERMNAGTKQPETVARAWDRIRQAGRWYGSLSKTRKIAIGAGIGFGVGALSAVATGSALAMFGAGAVAAGRRAGGVLFTGTVGGAVAGFVKGNVDAFASKYVDRKQQETKETFSQKKLGETLENRLKIRKTGKHIRTAGTVGAGAAVVTASVVAGRSIAEGLHDVLPESMQQTMDSVATTDSQPAEEAVTSQPVEEVHAVEQTTEQSIPSVEEKSPDDFTDEYVPLIEQDLTPNEAESVTNSDTGSEVVTNLSTEQTPQSTESVWDTQTYLHEILQNMQADEVGAVENSPVPDDVLSETENINILPEEPTPVYTVDKGDNIWKILEKNLQGRGSFEGLSDAQRINLIDALKDKVTGMSPNELKEIGVASGDADMIRVGDHLNLSQVLDEESVGKVLTDTKDLTLEQMKSIDSQQESIIDGEIDVPEKTDVSPHHPESTGPAPFTSISSQTPPPFTSISSISEATEQVPSGNTVRAGDFPRAKSDFENAMKVDAIRDINTGTSRSVVENLFNNHNIFSRSIEGNEKMFHANWNAISQLTMKDVFNGDGKLILGGGRMSPTLLGADAERLVRTMVDQVADGMADRGVPNAQSLLTEAQQEDWSVGTFFERIGKELETQTSADVHPEPVATLASLDASEVVAQSGENPPPSPAEDVQKPQAQEPSRQKIERVRRTEPILQAEVGGAIDNDKVAVGGRAGVRIGGNRAYQYIDVRTNDAISPDANGLIERDYLSTNPTWRDMTTRELIERDPTFEKVWRQYVGSEDGDPQTVDHRWGRISQEGKSPGTPLYRAPIDPEDIEKLKDLKGGDALKQLEDQLEEYKDRHKRPIRIPGNRIRIYPFKD